MQLAKGLASVTDMSILALAVGLALTFEGPDQADILSSMLGDIKVPTVDHGANGSVARFLEPFDQARIRMSIYGGDGPTRVGEAGFTTN